MRNIQALPLAFAILATAAQAAPGHLPVQTIDQLKTTYLDCERRASVAMLGLGDAADCSVAHEELMRRGFGGDWNRMLAWWKSQRAAAEKERRRAADESVRVAPWMPAPTIALEK